MTERWETAHLGKILQLQRGHDLPTQDRIRGPVPIIGSFGVTGYHNTAKYPGPGVAIGRSGASFGKATIVNESFWPLNTCLFVSDFNGNHPKWVFHLLNSIDFSAFNSGSAQPSLNRNFLQQIPVILPSLHDQQAIAEVLEALDDKITANRHTAENGRQLASCHFTHSHRASHASVTIAELIHWGDLVVGDGYRTKRGEHAETGFRIIRVTDVVEGTVTPTGPDRVAAEFVNAIGGKAGRYGDVVLTTKGTVGRVALTPELDEQIVYSPQICYFRCSEKSRVNRFYLRYWFESEEFRTQADHRMNNTDMAPYISLADIRSLQLTIPEADDMRVLSDQLATLENTAQALLRENASLANLRDTLLPHLMSGRLRVKDAEKQVEAVV